MSLSSWLKSGPGRRTLAQFHQLVGELKKLNDNADLVKKMLTDPEIVGPLCDIHPKFTRMVARVAEILEGRDEEPEEVPDGRSPKGG